MKNIFAILLIPGMLLFIQSRLLAQNKALQKQDNKTKAVYIPVKTKDEIAAERVQKREKAGTSELQLQYEQVVPYEQLSIEKEKTMEIYKVDETPIEMQMKEYKPEVKEEQEQQLKKEELQKPEKEK